MSSVSSPVPVGDEGGFRQGGCLLSQVHQFTRYCCMSPTPGGWADPAELGKVSGVPARASNESPILGTKLGVKLLSRLFEDCPCKSTPKNFPPGSSEGSNYDS